MSDYIGRQETIESVNSITNDINCPIFIAAALHQIISEIPAADVRPVVRGQWIEKRGPKFVEDGHFKLHGEYGVIGFVCSVCGRFEKEREPFCNCGADMRPKNDE